MDDKLDEQERRAKIKAYAVHSNQFVSLMLRHHEPLPPSWRLGGVSDEPTWQAVEAEGETCADAND